MFTLLYIDVSKGDMVLKKEIKGDMGKIKGDKGRMLCYGWEADREPVYR